MLNKQKKNNYISAGLRNGSCEKHVKNHAEVMINILHLVFSTFFLEHTILWLIMTNMWLPMEKNTVILVI